MELGNAIKPELLLLVPVLDLIALWLKRMRVKLRWIGLTVFVISFVLVALYEVARVECDDYHDYFMLAFAVLTQCSLIAGASVYMSDMVLKSRQSE